MAKTKTMVLVFSFSFPFSASFQGKVVLVSGKVVFVFGFSVRPREGLGYLCLLCKKGPCPVMTHCKSFEPESILQFREHLLWETDF